MTKNSGRKTKKHYPVRKLTEKQLIAARREALEKLAFVVGVGFVLLTLLWRWLTG